MRLHVVALALTLAAPSFAGAQPVANSDAAPKIQVMAMGAAERPADWASIEGVVRAQAKDQQTALRLMSIKKDAIVEGLARLADAKSVTIDTSNLAFQFLLSAGCGGEVRAYAPQRYVPPSRDSDCAPTGVEGTIQLVVKVHSAEQLGALASLAIQLGVEDVAMAGSGVDDPAALQAKAERAAFDNALAQATLLANAANEHLGRLTHLSRGGPTAADLGPRFQEYSDQAVRVALLKPRVPITPDVALKLTPPKVNETSSVVVEFELLK